MTPFPCIFPVRVAMLQGRNFVLVNAFGSMFFDMTFKAYCFQHLWTVIRLAELSFSRFHPVFMVCKELRCLSAPLTATFGSFQCLSSIGCINRCLTVAMPDVLERW